MSKLAFVLYVAHGDTITSSGPILVDQSNVLGSLIEKGELIISEYGENSHCWIEDSSGNTIWDRDFPFTVVFTGENLESLRQLSNEAAMRGVNYFHLEVGDWRDIPTSQEELSALDQDEQLYWKSIAANF